VGSGQITKAKSEAALLARPRPSGQNVPVKKRQNHGRSKTGTNTPRGKSRQADDDDWLARTRATTHGIVQEAKGQSWLASRDSSTTLTHLESDDDMIDEGYEELAALSAQQARFGSGSVSPAAERVKSPAWGSRYGSRPASRGTSRRGSVTGLRTPLAMPGGQDVIRSYFNEDPLAAPLEADFVIAEPDESEDGDDEDEVARLSDQRGHGVGGIVDRLMNFNLFSVQESGETTTDEETSQETEDLRTSRVGSEAKRKQEEKDRMTRPPAPPEDRSQALEEGAWQDAAWLLSVASKAMF
jgi:hypothetical protein